MASSSTSFVHKSFKYDVFLSFRGEDTRTNFVDHLYQALKQKSIHTYKDDQRIKKGKNISDELIRSIEDSKFYIIVFSKNYASSSWCLDELVKIMECHRSIEHTAYPLFYDVEPSEVRKQSGSVAEAFAKHEKKEAARKWREALKEAADLAGWELKNTAAGHEAQFIQKIVEELSLELHSTHLSIDKNLVGMETRINDVVSYLGIGFDDVRMIGIQGMGGGGKTTLARAVFDRICFQFEGKSFVENVREFSNASLSGLKLLQNQVLSDVLNDKDINVSSVYDGKHMMKRIMPNRKVLVVLDDVDHIDQLEALAGEPNWFKPGSRIIVTTRDEQVLIAHRVKLIHDVNLLSDMEAICLFNKYAFGGNIPIQQYEKLSNQVVGYAAGLPLTVRVLGSFLCGKNELEWVDYLKRLKMVPLAETLKRLELSYIGLEQDYKEIFLDIACIMKGWRKDNAIKALESCGLHARNGLRVLEQRSLISISNYNSQGYKCVGMHDHIQEMGRNIVRRSHPDKPHKHSRLWIADEIEEILSNDLGTKATRCILLHAEKLNPHIVLKGLGKMKKLRLLALYLGYCSRTLEFNNIANPDFPNALQYLRVDYYPCWSLPKAFQANNLVSLEMANSQIVQLWEAGENKVLNKLRFLNLSWSKLSTLDLRFNPNLETLNLRGCSDLVELHMHVGCFKLIYVDISHSRLRTLDLGLAPNLEKLILDRCCDLEELHMPSRCLNLRSLQLTNSKLRTLDIGLTPVLKNLDLGYCYYLEELHMTDESQKLKNLNIFHSKLRTLDIGRTPVLENLDLRDCYYLEELHMADECQKLKNLNICHSKLRTLDIGLTPVLENLDLGDCYYLEELHMADECQKLKNLNICHSKLRTLDIGLIPVLENLDLGDCYYLEELHMADECQNLKNLNSCHSKLRTLNLGRTPNLRTLYLQECCNLVELHMLDRCLYLMSLQLANSKLRTLDIGLTPNLKTLDLRNCYDLEELHMSVGCLKLTSVDLTHSRLRTLDLGLALNLEILIIDQCPDLVELQMPNRCLNLISLQITNSKLRTLDIGLTPNLKNLDLENSYYLEEFHMVDDCQKLANLNLSHSKLRTLNLGLTPNLKNLYLAQCCNLVELITPLGCLKEISHLYVSGGLGFRALMFQAKGYRSCSPLAELHLIEVSLESCPLHPDNSLSLTRNFEMLIYFYREDQLSLTRNFEMLISLVKCACTSLEKISGSICGLRRLRKLKMEGSFVEVPKDLDGLECLEELILLSTKINHLPDSICKLKHLKSLELNSCSLLEKLREDLGRLECLEKLTLYFTTIKDLPDSICMLKHLKSLELNACFHLEKLPEDLGRLECLEKLTLYYATIKHLPDSICMLKHLKSLELNSCFLLEKLPEDLGQLECLEKFTLLYATIKHLPDSICMLKHLKSLELNSCFFLEKLPKDLGRLEYLEKLKVMKCERLQEIPNSIGEMKYLKHINLANCIRIEKLPEALGCIECLKELDIEGTSISHIPQSILLLKGDDFKKLGRTGKANTQRTIVTGIWPFLIEQVSTPQSWVGLLKWLYTVCLYHTMLLKQLCLLQALRKGKGSIYK
ncbi:unnamed protein product [Lactuca virosa]|uniref:TIR domain-containing protein n=1 Tax=Lactuca virosa TaxID=75947 RepID=A0AAU9M7J5_9ASTR|nr:unnamed protein product [Lactuca virosa]